MMKRWVGRWIIFVGAIHCVFGAIVFIEPLSGILRDGLWNAVSGYPGRPLAFWFELVGVLTILLGVTIDRIEKDQRAFPASLVYGFSLLVAVTILAMPISGGWLLVPGAAGLLLKRLGTGQQEDH